MTGVGVADLGIDAGDLGKRCSMRVAAFSVILVFAMALSGQAVAMCEGQVVLEDSFDDTLTGWELSQDFSRIEDGILRITPKSNRGHRIVLRGFFFNLRNKKLCLEINVRAPESSSIGVVYWYADQDNYFTSMFSSREEIEGRTFRKKDGSWLRLSEHAALPEGSIADEQSIRVQLEENVATLIINGEELQNFRAQTPEGDFQIGIYAENNTEDGAVEIEVLDFAVRQEIGPQAAFQDFVQTTCINADLPWTERSLACRTVNFLGIGLEKDRALAHMYTGDAALHAGDFTLALQSYNQAVELDPPNPAAVARIETAMTRVRDAAGEDEEIAQHTAAISEDPANMELYVERARAYGTLGAAELAFDDWTKVLAVADEAKAMAEAEGGAYEPPYFVSEARSSVQFLIPYVWKRRFWFADYELAAEYLSVGIEISEFNWQIVPFLESRATVHEAAGNNDLAIADYRRALELTPGSLVSEEALKRLQ